MSRLTLTQLTGLAGAFGGLLLAGSVAAVALLPEGCIGSECYRSGRSHREWDGLAPFFLTALALILAGLLGLVARARASARFGRLGGLGLAASLFGVAVLGAAGAVQEVFFNGDFPWMPAFVIPGVLALAAGFLLVGGAVLRAGVLPRWAAWLMVAGALAMFGFNDQNAQVLMAVPLGLAWMAAGYSLLTGVNRTA